MIKGLSLPRAKERADSDRIPALRVLALTFIPVFILFVYHAAPGVSFHDSGEFSMAVASAGLPHSPGAPTWVILNVIFRMLCFGADAARTSNLFSAFCGSITVAFASTFVFRQFGDRSNATRNLAALITSLSLVTCGAFLEQSFMAEQYTLMTALMSAMLLILQTNEKEPKLKWMFSLGLLAALGLGNHPSQIVLGPLLIVVGLQNRKSLGTFKVFGIGLLGYLLGLLVFLWLPIRSAAHPLMDWGHPRNWENFMWSITRQQWEVRPMTAAPTGFIKEWMRSYNFLGEMGFVATAIGLVGVVLSLRRAIRPVIWLFWLVVPYAAILMLGHVRQGSMDLIYIRFYGVRDWHIPLYMVMSIFGAMGTVWLLDMRHKVTEKFRVGSMITVSGLLAANLPIRLSAESLRTFNWPQFYTEASLTPIPKDAMVFCFNDNSTHVMGYQHYFGGVRPDIFFSFGMPYHQFQVKPGPFDANQKLNYFNRFVYADRLNPLNNRKLPRQDVINRPIFTEYTTVGNQDIVKYMLPTGFLFELKDRPTTNEEVVAAYEAQRKKYPQFWIQPDGPQHRLTRECMSFAYGRLGIFFSQRGLYKQSIECLELGLKWEPENVQLIFPLAASYDETKDFIKAEQLYLDCIDKLPDFVTPRQNLALLYFYAKEYDLAEKYAKEELYLTKGDAKAQKVLDLIAKERVSGRPDGSPNPKG